MVSQRFSKPVNEINCATCQTLLTEYVRLQLTNQSADATHPAVALHIESCPTCQAAYFREFRAQGLAQPLPALQEVGRRAGAARALDQILQRPGVTWWQRMTEHLHRLTVEIPILVQETTAAFGNLPSGLAPQLTLVASLRTKSATDARATNAIELLTLPAPAADLQIKVSTGAVVNHQSTLIVQLETLMHQPIAHARTTLRDGNGSLLEQRATDADGLVIFGELAPAKYNIQIKQAEQTLEFSVTLVASPNP